MSSEAEVQALMLDKDQPGFTQTPFIAGVVKRSTAYMEAGLPIHFIGPAGTGKTSLALYLAAQIGNPVILLHGDDELSTSQLTGGEFGYRKKKVVDRFIHSVLKVEENVAPTWVDKCLTVACKEGFTLVYDEFTRSHPEANNILLSVLEEKILDLYGVGGQGHISVNPNFRAIFTSNPSEYAGVHGLQDALRDRMMTIRLTHFDKETEIGITQAKTGLDRAEASLIVEAVRGQRAKQEMGLGPTVRASIMIGKVLKQAGARAARSDAVFTQVCRDVFDLDRDYGFSEAGMKDKVSKLSSNSRRIAG